MPSEIVYIATYVNIVWPASKIITFFPMHSGYLVIRMAPALGTPVIKQLKWFEGNFQHILDMTLDPMGEWLACACLDGALYLLPILNLIKTVCAILYGTQNLQQKKRLLYSQSKHWEHVYFWCWGEVFG